MSITDTIKTRWAERKARRSAERRCEGYAYATEWLHAYGPRGVCDLQCCADGARTAGDYDEFDRGIEDAIWAFERGVLAQRTHQEQPA